jgi:hypothetical protein
MADGELGCTWTPELEHRYSWPRPEEGYYLTEADVNAYWLDRYGHKCPYAEPLPISRYLQKKGNGRPRPRVRSIHDASHVTRGDRAGQQPRSHSEKPSEGGRRRPPNTAPNSVPYPSTAARPSPPKTYVTARLMPPPGMSNK